MDDFQVESLLEVLNKIAEELNSISTAIWQDK